MGQKTSAVKECNYRSFLRGMNIPSLQTQKKAIDEYTADFHVLSGRIDLKGPGIYAEGVEKLTLKHICGVSDGTGRDEKMRAVIVGNDMNIVRKKAAVLGNELSCYVQDDGLVYIDDDEYDDCEGVAFDYDEDNPSCMTCEIDLGKEISGNEREGNPYVIKTQKILRNIGASALPMDGIFFTGLRVTEIDEQLDAVCSASGRNIFVGVTKEVYAASAVKELILKHGFEIIVLEDTETGYYERIAKELIKMGEVKFDKTASEKLFMSAVIKLLGNKVDEEGICEILTKGRKHLVQSGRKQLALADFSDMLSVPETTSLSILDNMTGLKGLKAMVKGYIAVRNENKRNPLANLECKHVLCEGNPGTGKTEGARILSNILAEEGITNGTFVKASRSDIIGKYVGHTAPKVAKLFKKAEGGILFIDEAAFLMQQKSGGYTDEAVKEFVRYMEECRNVIVIFAMYPGEAENFLKLDAGLTSRIAETVKFDDYTETELADIFEQMMIKKNYKPAEDIRDTVIKHFASLKKSAKTELFGNAREARNLADRVITEIAIRNAGDSCVDPDVVDKAVVISASAKIRNTRQTRKKTDFGFSFEAGNGGIANAAV